MPIPNTKGQEVIMKFSAIAILTLAWTVHGQQAGTLEEGHPTIMFKTCTNAGGCTEQPMKLTLDANWRWVHEGGTNCYVRPCFVHCFIVRSLGLTILLFAFLL